MIRAFSPADGSFLDIDVDSKVPANWDKVIWIDLVSPSAAEEAMVEAALTIGVPTPEEMGEIEDSARLYRDGDVLVMTAVVIDGAAEGKPSRAQVTLLLTATPLVCVRYVDPLPFKLFEAKCALGNDANDTPADIFASLLESFVERAADILEVTASDLQAISARLFFNDANRRKSSRVEGELSALIQRLGRRNMTAAILRESLLSLGRMISFARSTTPTAFTEQTSARLKQIERDVRSLAEYEQHLTGEIAYLHESSLGLINLDQNRIIKAFSIAAVLFLPPTVVGTIYGMNFTHMPELDWVWGYPFALALMILSAVLPFLFFKWRGGFSDCSKGRVTACMPP
ncbi:MAG: magnesium transporter [Verrucomicrobiaceae bacterium]|nr:MAG: magnesium transporter [Verrucomicrobiaceae bacterium]